jgi:hypothetical protein
MKTQNLLILLLLFKWRALATEYILEQDVESKDVKVSLNDNFTIAAFNSEKFYILYFVSNSFKNISYQIPFENCDIHVYSISALTMKNNMTISFVQVVKKTRPNFIVLSRVTIDLTDIYTNTEYLYRYRNDTTLNKTDQEYILLKVDPQEKFAYVFADSFILSYNLLTNKVDKMNETNVLDCDGYNGSVIPYAFDLRNEWAVVAGLHRIHNGSRNKPCIFIFGLQSLSLIATRSIDRSYVLSSGSIDYNRDFVMSISINPSGTAIAIGQASLDLVTIACIIDNNISRDISQVLEITDDAQSIGFGRSVTWLNDEGALAVLIDKSETRNSLESKIQVYTDISCKKPPGLIVPQFVLPNNQQALHRIPSSHDKGKHFFLLILARSSTLLILRNDAKLVYIPSVAAGFCPMEPLEIHQMQRHLMPVSESMEPSCGPAVQPSNFGKNSSSKSKPTDFPIVYALQAKPCVSGTYKNVSGFGPCMVCPPGTKNPGGRQSSSCQKCNSTAVCPLGASNEVNLNDFNTTTQIFNYPDTPIIDNYDDVLLLNFIPNKMTYGCIVSSPLFVTVVFVTLSFTIWLIMLIMKKRQPTLFNIHRERVKLILKHTDLVGEGERLAGGLASIVIFAIMLYSIVFAMYYFSSYSSDDVSFREACQDDQRNTQFDNALQLSLPEPKGNDWKIFDLLDKQTFNMTVKLINTAAQCDHISVQQSKLRGYPEYISQTNCNHSIISSTTSFSFRLPTHTSTIQVNITGPYFIGALQLCLHGLSNRTSDKEEDHTLAELNVCQRFDTENQTIGLSTDFNVDLIKVINVTKPLVRGGQTNYSGIWKPIMKCIDDLSEELYYAKNGAYLRYDSDQTIFTVMFKEENYFLQNNKSPIIRRGAIIFHTYMFIFLFFDAIAMISVLYKLWIQPLSRRLLQSCDNHREHEVQSSHPEIVINVSYSVRHFLY